MALDEKRLERIEKKIDDQNEHLSSIDLTLQSQHISLEEHMERTDKLEIKVAPVVKWMYMTQGAAALLGLLATIGAILMVFK